MEGGCESFTEKEDALLISSKLGGHSEVSSVFGSIGRKKCEAQSCLLFLP